MDEEGPTAFEVGGVEEPDRDMDAWTGFDYDVVESCRVLPLGGPNLTGGDASWEAGG